MALVVIAAIAFTMLSVVLVGWTNYKQQQLLRDVIGSLRTANDSNDILLAEVLRLRQGCGALSQPTRYE